MADWIVELLCSKNLVMSINFGCHLQFRRDSHILWSEGGGLEFKAASGSMRAIVDKKIGGIISYGPFC
jgi:hypothetical protein